jgi:hypothetical protein
MLSLPRFSRTNTTVRPKQTRRFERSEEVAESLQHAFAECSEKEHWWRNFCEGPVTKLVPRRAAVQAIREILIEFAGPLAAERAKIDFAGEQVTVMELRALLEDLTGGATGYRILLRKAGCVQHRRRDACAMQSGGQNLCREGTQQLPAPEPIDPLASLPDP